MNGELPTGRVRGFALHFDNLYDSLNPTLVIEAIRCAISECKCAVDWNPEMVDWICDLVELSFHSSVSRFGDRWYRSRNGIPTGNSLSVMLANITVFYVLGKLMYNMDVKHPCLMGVRRFIDDLGGVWRGTVRQFERWADDLNLKLEDEFGLSL